MFLLTSHSTDVSFIASQAIARAQQPPTADGGTNGDLNDAVQQKADAMAALERQARAPQGFVAASTGPEGGNRAPVQAAAQEMAANPDAIDVDDDL